MITNFLKNNFHVFKSLSAPTEIIKLSCRRLQQYICY